MQHSQVEYYILILHLPEELVRYSHRFSRAFNQIANISSAVFLHVGWGLSIQWVWLSKNKLPHTSWLQTCKPCIPPHHPFCLICNTCECQSVAEFVLQKCLNHTLWCPAEKYCQMIDDAHLHLLINPRRASAARVTVVVVSVCSHISP